jgi:hypothetical protein
MSKAHPSSILHSDHMAIHQRRPGCMRPLSFCICFDVAGSWDDSWGNGDLTRPWQGNAGLREAATRRDSHPWMVEGLGWRLPPCIPTADPARPQIPQTAAEQSGPDLPPASFLSALALQSSTVAVKARVHERWLCAVGLARNFASLFRAESNSRICDHNAGQAAEAEWTFERIAKVQRHRYHDHKPDGPGRLSLGP